MIPSHHRLLQTIGDDKIKTNLAVSNNSLLKEVDEKLDNMVTEMKDLKNDIKDILELVKKKEERDMNKWLTWATY
tara:strand:+ start:3472 stop:3696 length:225 start_codon:yes stop_codon:yes gene_type:complete